MDPDRKRLHAACDPHEPLEVGDPRYAELDSGLARGPALAERLASRATAGLPGLTYTTGAPGAGLTTELRRTAHLLGDPSGANRRVVWVEPAALFAAGLIDTPTVLLAILAALEGDLPVDHPAPASTVLLNRIWSELLGTFEAGRPATAALAFVRQSDQGARRFRWLVEPDASRFATEVHAAIARLLDEWPGSRVVVIVDSLNRAAPLRDRLGRAARRSDRTFVEERRQLTLPCPAIVTCPLSVAFSGQPVELLPNLDPGAGERPPAAATLAAVEQMARRRLGPFLDDVGWDEARLAYLATEAQGLPRRVVAILRSLVAAGSSLSDLAFRHRVSQAAVEWRPLALPLEARKAAQSLAVGLPRVALTPDSSRRLFEAASVGALFPARSGGKEVSWHLALNDEVGVP